MHVRFAVLAIFINRPDSKPHQTASMSGCLAVCQSCYLAVAVDVGQIKY
jgi:hypothetical protein